MTKLVYLIR